MLKKMLVLAAGGILMAGCATTQQPSMTAQLQSRIGDLESQVSQKNDQIQTLEGQVNSLSSQVGQLQAQLAARPAPLPAVQNGGVHKVEGDVIRVSVSPKEVQRALKKAGQYTGPIDGKVGPGTKEAISAFQKAHHLKSDGIVGMQTWAAMKVYLK